MRSAKPAFLLLSFLFAGIFWTCSGSLEKAQLAPPLVQSSRLALPDWAKDAGLYEVNIRQFTREGTFKGLQGHLHRLKDMGVEILWLMPISPISETNRKGSLGSYYSVTDFRAINPEYGTATDLHDLIQEIHRLGMKVILDWVPHHTGWDHPWVKDHPEYYSHDIDGNIVDPINEESGEPWGWTDVAELNLESAAMRNQIAADMIYWIKEFDIDGYRIDHAHRVPLDYWEEVMPKVEQAKPGLFLLAEGEDAWLKNRARFHATYAWQFHHAMNSVAKGEANVNVFDHLLWKDRNEVEQGFHIYFTSNHDENSWAGTVFERMGPAHKALAVLSFTLDGMPLVYSGQEAPLRKRLEFFDRDPIDWNAYAYADFYKVLFELKRDNPALWNGSHGGTLQRINKSTQIYAFTRSKGQNEVIVLLNLSAQEASSPVIFGSGVATEVFTQRELNFHTNMEVTMQPWEYQVWVR